MQAVELKLKQASAVLGMPTNELHNLVQFGAVKPRRRYGLYVFDTVCLYPRRSQALVQSHFAPSGCGPVSNILCLSVYEYTT